MYLYIQQTHTPTHMHKISLYSSKGVTLYSCTVFLSNNENKNTLPSLSLLSLASGYEVVALGTGNYNTKENFSSSGRIVHDSHAVVTARRSLMRLAVNICTLSMFPCADKYFHLIIL